ncbi:MAG TPA: hypothetical protein DEA08_05120 [Planctomycetes bacterium]|nr:hypothetical protein [Planctomycetota bacterium]|tara:strand:+ start:988 stop:1470 length:483 start_codon:yes stop_codon:yes gene_type:complete
MGDESHRNLLKHSKVFDALSDEQLDRVVALGQVESFPEGAVIVEEDKAGKSCYFLIQGRVDIEIRSPFGGSDKVQKIATIKRGEMFGELSLVDGFLRSASARAAEAVELLAFENEQLEALMEDDPRIGYQIMRNVANVLSSRIRTTNMKLRNTLSDILYY